MIQSCAFFADRVIVIVDKRNLLAVPCNLPPDTTSRIHSVIFTGTNNADIAIIVRDNYGVLLNRGDVLHQLT